MSYTEPAIQHLITVNKVGESKKGERVNYTAKSNKPLPDKPKTARSSIFPVRLSVKRMVANMLLVVH